MSSKTKRHWFKKKKSELFKGLSPLNMAVSPLQKNGSPMPAFL